MSEIATPVNTTPTTQDQSAKPDASAKKPHGEKFTLLKKRRDQHKLKEQAARRSSASHYAKKNRVVKEKFLRPDEILRASVSARMDKERLARKARAKIQPKKLNKPTPLLVIRTKTITHVPRACYSSFNKLGLNKLHSAKFVRPSEENLELLEIIRPYITYGEPNLNSIKSLIYKRGQVEVNGRKCMLSSNTLVEEHLGEFGMICLEDLVHEIATLGPNFDAVVGFLLPFTFPQPKEHREARKIVSSIKDRTSWEAKNKLINELVESLN